MFTCILKAIKNHFDSENCTCTDNGQGGHVCGQGKTLTCIWQFMGKNNYVLPFGKKSDRGTHVVGIKGYLYDMDFDVGKTVLLFTTC